MLTTVCTHEKIITVYASDDTNTEDICKTCGAVLPDNESLSIKKCLPRLMFMQGADNLNSPQVHSGDSIYTGLEKILLPLTVQNHIKGYRDNFDKAILNGYVVYNRLMRICEQLNIPKYYAQETMRLLLKRKRGLYSLKMQLATLMEVIQTEKLLVNRLPALMEIWQNAKGN